MLSNEKRKEAWKLISAILNLAVIVLSALVLLSEIFAPQVIRYILASGFSMDLELENLAVDLLRIQLISAIIFGMSGLAAATLNSHHSFFISALAPAMYQIGLIIGAKVLAPFWGIYGMAWGVNVGALLHLLVQLPTVLRLPDRHYHLTLGLKLASVREVIRMIGPRLLGVAVVQINFLVNNNLASYQTSGKASGLAAYFVSMPVGSITGIYYGFSLMMMPEIAIAQAISTAALPTFSAQAARGRFEEMRASLAASLRGILLMAIPASLGLILLRKELVAVILQRGAFTAESTELVSWALLWYAAGLVGHSLVEILSRAFYALHDTRTPVTVGICAMVLNMGLSVVFSHLFFSWGWMPHGGLALANSVATFLEAFTLLYLMRRRLQGIEGHSLWKTVAQSGVAALLMGGVLFAWLSFCGPSLKILWLALGGVTLGGLIYGLALVIMGVKEVNELKGMIRARLNKILQSSATQISYDLINF